MKAGQINKETQPAKVVQFDFHSFAEAYIEDLRRTISEMSIDELEKLYNEVVEAVRSDATIHFIGNGGSAATPSHSAGDWSKELRVRTISHVDNVASLTAFANDVDYDEVFVGQLETFLRPGDLVVGFSGSGNSENVLRGLKFAKDHGCTTAAVTGDYKGGGGGFFLIHGESDLRSRLIDELPTQNTVIPFRVDFDGSRIIHPMKGSIP